MIAINHTSNWFPDFVCGGILDIDLELLKQRGITHIVFDLDKTLLHKGTSTISHEYVQFLKVVERMGFTVIIGSNTRRDTSFLSPIFGTAIVVPSGISYKPFPSFYRRIITEAGTETRHIAMVGDHILNDVIGANHVGLTSILVHGLRRHASLVYRIYLRQALQHSNRPT